MTLLQILLFIGAALLFASFVIGPTHPPPRRNPPKGDRAAPKDAP